MNNTLRQVYILLFAALFFIAGNTANAQTSENDLKKEATKYFESEDFAHAYPLYSQLLSLHPDNADYNYRFGTCMLFTKEDKEKPIDYLLFALKSATTDKLAYYYLGGAYQLNYRFDDAIEAYNKFKQTGSSSEVKSHPVDHLIQMCGDGKTLLKDVHDLDVLQKKELSLSDYFHAYDLSANGGTMLIEPDDFKSKLDKKKGFSSVIYLSPDRNEIFYSSYGDDGANGLDIYTVKRLPNGGFSKPTNLGTIINTPYDEEYPFYDAPTHTLYFSSKGHNSMGGYDVFKSVHNEAIDVWSTPVNMDFPINTPDDDILFIADTLGQTAFFASTRSSPLGSIDVYKIKIHQHAPENVLLKGIAFADMGRTPVSAKITVKSYETNKLIGVYNSNHDDGGYFMTLPNGMQVVYTVETPGHTTQTEAVVIPKQEELATLKQEIGYDSATDRLIITNHFESSGANQDYLLALDYIRSKAKLEVNVDSNALNVNNAIAQNSVQSNSIDNTDHNASSTDSGIPHYNNNLTTSANNAANQNNNSANNSSSTNNNSSNNQNTVSSQNNSTVANNNNSNSNTNSTNNNSSTDNNSNNTSSQNNTSVANNSNSSSNNNNSTNNSSVASNNQNNNTSSNNAANNSSNNQSSNSTDNSSNEQLVQAANNDAQQKQQDAITTKEEANKATQFANDKMQEAQNLNSEAQDLTDKANTYSDEKQKKDTLAKATALKQEANDDLNKANEAYQVAAQEQNDAQTKSKQADLAKQYSVSLDSAAKTTNSKDAIAQVQARQNVLTQQQQSQQPANNVTASSLILQQAQNTKQDSVEVAHNIEQLKKDADGLQQQSQNYIDQAQKTDNAQEKVALLQQAKDLSDSKKHKEDEIKSNEKLEQQLHNEYTAEVDQAKSANQQGSPQISSTDAASIKNEIDHYTPSSTNNNAIASTQNNSQNNNNSNPLNSSANNSSQVSNNNTTNQNSSTNNATNNSPSNTDNNTSNSANTSVANNNQNNSSSANNNTNSTNSNQSSSGNNTQIASNNNASTYSNATNANNNNSTVQFNNTQGVNNVESTTQVDYSNSQAADANKAAATYATESDNASKEASDTRKQAREATDPAEARMLSKKADSLDNVADQKKIQSSVSINSAGANQFTANKDQLAAWQNSLQNTNSDKLTTAMLLYNDANFYYNKSLIAKQKADSNSKSYIKQGFLDEENKNLATALLKQQEAKNIYLSVDPKLASIAANNAPINTTALNNNTNNNPDNSQQISQNNNQNNSNPLNSSGNNALQANATTNNQNSTSNNNTNTSNNTNQPDNNTSQGNQNISTNNSNNTSTTNQSGSNNNTANNSQSTQNNAVNTNSNSANSNQANTNTSTANNSQNNQNNSVNSTSSNATDNNTNTASNQNSSNNNPANNSQNNQNNTANNNQNNSSNTNSNNSAANNNQSNQNTNNSNNSTQPDNNNSVANNSQSNQNNSTNNSSTNSNQENNNTTTVNNNSNNSSSQNNSANNNNSVQNANRIDSLLSSNTNPNSANNSTANNSQNNNNTTAQNSSNNNTSSQNNSANNAANSNSNNSTASNNTAANSNPDNNAANNNQGNQNTATNNNDASNTNQSGNNSNAANNQSAQNTASTNSVQNNSNSTQNANRIDSLLSSNNQANQNNSANNTSNSSSNNTQNNNAVTSNSNNISSTQANNSGNVNNTTNPDNSAKTGNTTSNNRNSVTINITEDVFAETPTSPYSANKPIPIDQPLPEGLVFKVQIGAFRNAIQQNLFKGLQPISGEKTATGLTRYFAGIFKDYPGAKTAQGKVQEIGYKDAFVVAFYNGKRISLAQARAMLGGNENTQVAANNTQNTSTDNNTNVQVQQTQNNITANNTVSVATSVSDVKGLFFSVQIGALQHPAPASSFYNLRPLFSYNAPNGYIRYNCGIYSNLPNAKVAKQEIILKTPIKDAFIVAYSNGQRITINQANQLLSTGGTIPQSPDLDKMPNGTQIQNNNPAPQTNNAVNNNPAPTPVNLPAVTNNPAPQNPVKDTTSPAPANNQPVNNTQQTPLKDTTANTPANVPAPVTNNTPAPQTPVKDTTANTPATNPTPAANNNPPAASASIGSRSFSSSSIDPGGDVTVSVTIHRGTISGFAKLEETIPDGFTATEGEKQGATFKFEDGKVQWVWLGLPNDSVFTVTYKLTALSTTSGTQSISGRFLYTMNNEKQEVAIPASVITVGSSVNNTSVTPATNNTSTADTGKVIFTVQVGSFSGPIPVDMANKLLQISKQGIKAHKEDNGVTSYTIGEYHDYTSADEMKKELVTDGYDKSFVVAYFNGKKISLEQAQLLNNK